MSFVASAGNSGSNTSPTFTIPATASAGQSFIAIMSQGNSDVMTAAPSGMTLEDTQAQASAMHTRMYSGVITSGGNADPGATKTWTLSASRQWTTAIAVFDDVDTDVIAQFEVAVQTSTSAVNGTTPGITTSVEGWLVEIAIIKASNGVISSWTNPTGWTTRRDGSSGSNLYGPACAIGDYNSNPAAAGTYGGDTWVPNVLNTPSTSCKYTLILTPVSATNQNPTCSVAADDETPAAGQEVTVTLTASDSDGTIVSKDWTNDLPAWSNFTVAGDGDSATFNAPYSRTQDQYSVGCEVTDDDDATASDSVTITVDPHNVWCMIGGVSHAMVPANPTSQAGSGDPISVALSVDEGDGEVTLNWTITANGNPVDGTYEGRDGSSTTGGGAWESTTLSPGLTGSRTFLNLINDDTYNFYIIPVIDGVNQTAETIQGTPTGTGTINPPSGYTWLWQPDLTTDEGWTEQTGKTNNAGYNTASAVAYTSSGIVLTASKRVTPISSGGYTLYYDTGEVLGQDTEMILPNYFYGRAIWVASKFEQGLWPAAWFRPYGGGEGEIDWLESFGDHIEGATHPTWNDHATTLIKTPYGASQKNYTKKFDYALVGDDPEQGICNEHVYEIYKIPNEVQIWCDGVLVTSHTRVNSSMTTAEWDSNFEVATQHWYFRFTIQIGDDPDGVPTGSAGPVDSGYTEGETIMTHSLKSLMFAVPS